MTFKQIGEGIAVSLFMKADTGHSHLKAGIMGLAGSGKTFTASSFAIGMVGYMAERGAPTKKVVAFVDTENGSAWVAPRFEEAGIQLMVARTRSLTDLRDSIKWAADNADVLIIDSITHFWTIFCDEYAVRKNRRRGLEFSDWNIVKREWRENFTDNYLNSKLHILMCGRQGYEYDMQVNDAGKKELVKTGVKMKAEGETGFEPSLLFQMEQEQTIKDGSVEKVERVAYVLKDRSTALDGKELRNPDFASFLPHVRRLDIGGAGVAIDTERNNRALFNQDGNDTEWKQRETQREIALEEIQAELDRMFPGQSADSKTARGNYIEEVFQTRSKTAIEKMYLDKLVAARAKIWIKSRGHEYGVGPPQDSANAEVIDEHAESEKIPA
jgi:hypothetical protein